MEEKLISLGAFELESPIGEGAMGVVWGGIHRQQGVRVAVKIVSQANASVESFLDAFRNEVRSAARLYHPSIISLLDYGVTDESVEKSSDGRILANSPYYAMEYADGGTLPRPKSPLAWNRTKFILLELLDALAHAHARDVIHRDIKPTNVMLSYGEGGVLGLKLTDFGIAKALDSHDSSSTVAGTPRYMSPEQILGQIRDQGPWTDLYSLGCLAYQFATGRRIFSHARGTELLMCHLQESPEPVSGDYLPVGFQWWLDRMLAKNPHERFQFAAEAAWVLSTLPEPKVSEAPVEIYHEEEKSGLHSSVSWILSERSGQSSIFQALFPEGEKGEGVDLSDELLNDLVGDTVRMDVEDIEQALSRGIALKSGGNTFTTLSSLFSEIKSSGAKIYNGDAIPVPSSWRRGHKEVHSGHLLGAGLGLWGLRSIPFVDRFTERDKIYSKLVETRNSSVPHCLIIRGLRGSGKTRLVEWMVQRSHELALCHHLKAIHYLEPHQNTGLARAIMYYLGCQGLSKYAAYERVQKFFSLHPILEEVHDDALALLELMHLPEDPEHVLPKVVVSSVEEQYSLFLRFLKRLCFSRPCILWLEDIQWSTHTLNFIDYIYLHQEDLGVFPLLILATYCDERIEDDSPQAQMVKRVLNYGRVEEIVLKSLDPASHLELVEQLLGLDSDLSRQVAERTSGNPLFAIQLIGDWVERGILELGSDGFKLKEDASSQLPDSLHEVWLSRLRMAFEGIRASQYAWEMMEIAAVLGNQLDETEWNLCCDIEELVGDRRLVVELLLSHHLFERVYNGFRFTHNMLRESLIRYSKENQRYRVHHISCAEMLEQSSGLGGIFQSERMAMHYLEAGNYEKSLAPLLKAADIRMQLGEYEEAHRLFEQHEQSLIACHADEASPQWAFGWLARVKAYMLQGIPNRAESLIEKSLKLTQTGQSILLNALVHRELGFLRQSQNRTDEAIEAFSASLAYFDELTPRRKESSLSDRALSLWGIGRVYLSMHCLDLAIGCLQEAIEIQLKIQDNYGLGRSYKVLGNCYQHGGDYETARINLEYAKSMFEQTGNRQDFAHCLNDIGEIYRLGYKMPEEAEGFYRSAMEIYKVIGSPDIGTPITNLGLLLLDKKRYGDAKALYSERITIIEASESLAFDLNWLYAGMLPCCAAGFDWIGFEEYYSKLALCLSSSRVVDADILYCCEEAYKLCMQYGFVQYGEMVKAIALLQAEQLGDEAAVVRLSK